MTVLQKTTLRPLQIGPITIDTPLVLAPMAGVTSHAFRLLCKRHGVGLVVTELLSSHAIHYKNAKTFGMFDWTDAERPVSVQLFGGEPALMAEAAQVVEAHGADIVDLNMGCWVPKVAKTGAGATLLKDVCQAEAVVKAMVDAVKIPVTVKIRSGWDPSQTTGIDFARRAQDAGAQAIAVHARYASQGFTGTADWSDHPPRQRRRHHPGDRQRRRGDAGRCEADDARNRVRRRDGGPRRDGQSLAVRGHPALFGDGRTSARADPGRAG